MIRAYLRHYLLQYNFGPCMVLVTRKFSAGNHWHLKRIVPLIDFAPPPKKNYIYIQYNIYIDLLQYLKSEVSKLYETSGFNPI